jgi:hypothetical protein
VIDGPPERGATSSVRVATSTRGYDISVHVYVGTPPLALSEAGDLAIDEYLRIFSEMKARIEQKLREVA